MAIAAWAEQQQRELNLRARRLARSKVKKKKKQMDIKWSKTMFFICGIDYLSKYKLWMYFLNIFFF